MGGKKNGSIRRALKSYRLARLWTIRQMAAATGLSEASIHNFESGRSEPTALTLAKIRARLGNFESEDVA